MGKITETEVISPKQIFQFRILSLHDHPGQLFSFIDVFILALAING